MIGSSRIAVRQFLLSALGQKEEAVTAYRGALAICETLTADFPAEHRYRADLAASRYSLGKLLHDLGDSIVFDNEVA